jgi:hypothetical protein
MKTQLSNWLLNLLAKVFFGKNNFNFLDVGNIKIDMTKEDKEIINIEAQNFGSHADSHLSHSRGIQLSADPV